MPFPIKKLTDIGVIGEQRRIAASRLCFLPFSEGEKHSDMPKARHDFRRTKNRLRAAIAIAARRRFSNAFGERYNIRAYAKLLTISVEERYGGRLFQRESKESSYRFQIAKYFLLKLFEI